MGLFTYTFAGGGFVLIGAWEALALSFETLTVNPPSSSLVPPPASRTKNTSFSSTVTFIAISILSLLFIFNALISIIDALDSKDSIGMALQLEIIVIAFLFFLYSAVGLSPHFTNFIPLSSSILNMLSIFAFVEEFLFFYLRRKDPNGIENRYYDLLLVPIAICVFSTTLELKSPKSNYVRMVRGIGLVLQGTWFVQMGFSFYTDLIVNGCSLHEKSRGNYTVKCRGHPEYHRGVGIATLQFNCHLAFLVLLVVGVHSLSRKKHEIIRDSMKYKPLGTEMQQLDGGSQFTLDSDDDYDENGISEEGNTEMQKAIALVSKLRVNGCIS